MIKRLVTTPDLYYQHRIDLNVSLEETYGTLEELRKEEQIRFIGISEPNTETFKKVAKVSCFRFTVGQPYRAKLLDSEDWCSSH
ncbi:hypothetical protein ACEPAI_9949 [Sanghuangporus weigelae]